MAVAKAAELPPSQELIQNRILEVFGDAGYQAIEIARCESNFNATAKNKSSSASGVFQIMGFWADYYGISRQDLFNWEINIEIAKRIYDRSNNFNAWVCQ